eukprot:jgi/Mesvir1/19287/Mv10362-RA.1
MRGQRLTLDEVSKLRSNAGVYARADIDPRPQDQRTSTRFTRRIKGPLLKYAARRDCTEPPYCTIATSQGPKGNHCRLKTPLTLGPVPVKLDGCDHCRLLGHLAQFLARASKPRLSRFFGLDILHRTTRNKRIRGCSCNFAIVGPIEYDSFFINLVRVHDSRMQGTEVKEVVWGDNLVFDAAHLPIHATVPEKMPLFSKKPDVKAQVRESKREISQGVRALDREVMQLQREEEKLIAEIKRAAKQGNQDAAKILAKQLVRLRAQQTKMRNSQAQLRGVGTHIQAMQATAAVAQGMKTATSAMTTMNQVINPVQQQKVAMEFSKQSQQLDMAEEIMGSAMDDAFENDGEEEETNELVNEVLDDIGVTVAGQLVAAPSRTPGLAGKQAESQADEIPAVDEDLAKRLAALRS